MNPVERVKVLLKSCSWSITGAVLWSSTSREFPALALDSTSPDFLAARWRSTLNGIREGVIRFIGLVVNARVREWRRHTVADLGRSTWAGAEASCV